MAVVVGAGELDRRREAGKANRLQTDLVEIDVLETAPDILAGDHLLAGQLLRRGDGLGDQHRIIDAVAIERAAELARRRLALAGVDDQLLDVGEGGIVGPGAMPVQLLEALGAVARRGEIGVAGPPDRDEPVHREIGLHGLLHGGGVHRAPAVHDEEIRLVAPDVEPLRTLVLHVGGRDGIELEIEADLLGERVEQRQRLLAEARVEVEIADSLALEIVERAAADIFEDLRGAVPIGVRRIEDPGEHVALGGGGEAIGHRQDRDLVDGGLGDQGQRDAGRPRIHDHGIFGLHGVVALQTLLGVVARLAFVDDELDAADAAVALVEHVEIIMHAVGDRRARSSEGAGAVGEQRHIDRILREGGGGKRERESGAKSSGNPLSLHDVSSFFCQYGKGQTRSFCFVVRQIWASPCGSTISTTMISTPVIMAVRCSTVARS